MKRFEGVLLISQRLNFGESKIFKFEPPRPEGARARGGISGKQHWRLGERYLDGQTPVGSGCGHIASPRPSDSAPKAKSLYPFQTPGSSKIFLGANGILLQVQFKSRSVGLLLKKKANSHLPESELRGAREADQLRKGKRLENRRVWKCSRALAAERRFRRQCLTIMSLWFLEFM